MYYRYNVRTGVERIKTNTKKYLMSSLTAVAMIAGVSGAAFAAAPTVSNQANSNACFGQARASYAKGGPNGALSPYTNGFYISQRKGDNPSNNAAYSAQNCPSTQYTASSTTLDACGYFVGMQTPTEVKNHTVNGTQYSTEKGTWTGISNNYGGGPVASLGSVSGTYSESVAIDAQGNISGTEHFASSQGTIDQTFAFSTTTNTWTVTVSATGDFAFLTSDTAGQCYTGTFPRP